MDNYDYTNPPLLGDHQTIAINALEDVQAVELRSMTLKLLVGRRRLYDHLFGQIESPY